MAASMTTACRPSSHIGTGHSPCGLQKHLKTRQNACQSHYELPEEQVYCSPYHIILDIIGTTENVVKITSYHWFLMIWKNKTNIMHGREILALLIPFVVDLQLHLKGSLTSCCFSFQSKRRGEGPSSSSAAVYTVHCWFLDALVSGFSSALRPTISPILKQGVNRTCWCKKGCQQGDQPE